MVSFLFSWVLYNDIMIHELYHKLCLSCDIYNRYIDIKFNPTRVEGGVSHTGVVARYSQIATRTRVLLVSW